MFSVTVDVLIIFHDKMLCIMNIVALNAFLVWYKSDLKISNGIPFTVPIYL